MMTTFLLLALLAADYDLLIRNARVLDGSGAPAVVADVAVKGGRIAAVGTFAKATATRAIDAKGRVLTPGFIDVHTHIEGGIERAPRADNFLLDGVTTVVTGNCGGSAEDLAAWFTKLERLRPGINIASLVGHNTVRTTVMKSDDRKATPAEMARMKALVDRAMKAGAVGFSTGLEYIPGAFAPPEEVVELAKVAKAHGGIYTSHLRDEGPALLEAMQEAIRVGRDAGIPVQISHCKQDTKRLWGTTGQMLQLIEESRAAGIDVACDQYPYTRSSTGLTIRVPNWAMNGGRPALLERLKAPATRAKIRAEMVEIQRVRGYNDFSYAWVASFPPNRSYEGKNISEINRLKGREATFENECETALELIEQGGPSMTYDVMGEDDIERIMAFPYTAIASDGGVRIPGEGVPHPRSYGTSARVLGEYVRVRGHLTLEDAVRRMTSLPADRFGFRDRGRIKEGAAADLVLFDPAKVGDHATYEKPHQYSQGFDVVIVNGEFAVENGTPTGAQAGRILRHRP
jgi:N-acyl-D-amino-acid deacylase